MQSSSSCHSQSKTEVQSFLAKVVFQIHVHQHPSSNEFDEQVRLIHAQDEVGAYQKASMLGKNSETSFINENGKQLSWRFIGITELINISNKQHGEELYSSSSAVDCADTYIDSIRHKSTLLQLNHQVEFTS